MRIWKFKIWKLERLEIKKTWKEIQNFLEILKNLKLIELKILEFENLKIIWDILLCGTIEKKNLKLYLGNKTGNEHFLIWKNQRIQKL